MRLACLAYDVHCEDCSDDRMLDDLDADLGFQLPRAARTGRIAVFGGAFDPVTVGHMACVSALLASGSADAVVMVPCARRRDKTLSASVQQRVAMCIMALKDTFPPGFPVCVSLMDMFAGSHGTATAMVHVLGAVRKTYPDATSVHCVVGSDLCALMPGWTGSQELLRATHGNRVLVVPRPGYTEDVSTMVPPFQLVHVEVDGTVDTSSTLVRHQLQHKRSIGHLVTVRLVL